MKLICSKIFYFLVVVVFAVSFGVASQSEAYSLGSFSPQPLFDTTPEIFVDSYNHISENSGDVKLKPPKGTYGITNVAETPKVKLEFDANIQDEVIYSITFTAVSQDALKEAVLRTCYFIDSRGISEVSKAFDKMYYDRSPEETIFDDEVILTKIEGEEPYKLKMHRLWQ